MPSGGARPGTGPKPALEKTLVEAANVARELKDKLMPALRMLGDAQEELMEVAIQVAKGFDYTDAKGSTVRINADATMLKFLLKLPLELVKLDPDDDSPFEKLMRSHLAGDVTVIKVEGDYNAASGRRMTAPEDIIDQSSD